jgi:hypothetical protein
MSNPTAIFGTDNCEDTEDTWFAFSLSIFAAFDNGGGTT